jgi:hypothetical protein
LRDAVHDNLLTIAIGDDAVAALASWSQRERPVLPGGGELTWKS